MAKLPISQVVVDEHKILNELRRILSTEGTWKDLMPTNVGSTILKIASGATTVNQHYILTALREAFLGTAVRDSSIFEGVRSLGVHISRKVPASTTAQLQNNLTTTKFISPYSEFAVGNESFYNLDQVVIGANGGTYSGLNLYQGEVLTFEFDTDTLLASVLPTLKLNVPGFVISDIDMTVWTEDKVSGEVLVWTKSEVGLFELGPTDRNYFEFTTGNGDVAFSFGNGEFGARLPNNAVLYIRAIQTKGSIVSGIAGERVRLVESPEVAGWTMTAITPGGDQKPALYYKQFGPVMFRSRRKAISATEVRAHIMAYPGVADCQLFFQRDIAPNDPAWQNVMRVCILPDKADTFGGANPNPQSAAWSAFTDWLQERIHHLGQIQPWNPTKLYRKVNVLVAVNRDVDREEIRILATERLLKLFQRKPGILGMRLSRSDIENACRIAGVDYIEVMQPTDETIPPDRSYYVVLDGLPNIEVIYSERQQGSAGVY